MMTTLEQRHVVRIVALITILLASVAAFLFLRSSENDETPAPEAESRDISEAPPTSSAPGVRAPHLREYPEPDTFAHLSYSGEAAYVVTGECKDAYFTVLIYPADVDYRENPRAAFYNKAEPCAGNGFSVSVPTPSPPYVIGGEYYVIRAHQSPDREWYDAY